MDTRPVAGPVLGPRDRKLDKTQLLSQSGGIRLTDTILRRGDVW